MFYSKKLKKFKEIKHCFFSRKGGVSEGLYKSLNCGLGSRDKRKNILKNLSYVAKKLKSNKKNLILMKQTHSNKVIKIKNNNSNKKIISDAIITNKKGIILGVLTADCVPILLFDYSSKYIACIHAGWRGAFSGIIENTITKIKKLTSQNNFYASVGPCIGRNNYEVDLKFYYKFVKRAKNNKRYFSKKNSKKKFFDLRNFINDKLVRLNVKTDHVIHDTFEESNNFFSYRRSSNLGHNDYGRCLSVIKLN